MATTRTESTAVGYRRRVDQIRRRVAAKFGHPSAHSVPPLSLVEHLMHRKQASEELAAMSARKDPRNQQVRALMEHAITRATWRQYKAALLFVLEEERQVVTGGALAEEINLAIRMLEGESQSGCLKSSRKTSGRKQKSFPDADFRAIVGYLESNRRKHRRAASLLTWLRAGRIVGVRPSEWRSAGLIEVNGQRAIRFGNAKTTNGRGNGTVRTLILDQATDEDIEHLDDMLYMLVEQDKQPDFHFDRELKLLSKYLRYVATRCLGKRSRYPSMYSLRHQFSADAKQSKTPAEIAAMMGHASDATAMTHYGRRAAGQGELKVSPVLAEVDTVRHRCKSASYQSRLKEGAPRGLSGSSSS